MKQEFNKELQQKLIQQGYTHMLCVGVLDKETEDYILIPLKAEDPRMKYEETDLLIEPMQSHDVNDMAAGDEFITFYVELGPI